MGMSLTEPFRAGLPLGVIVPLDVWLEAHHTSDTEAPGCKHIGGYGKRRACCWE